MSTAELVPSRAHALLLDAMTLNKGTRLVGAAPRPQVEREVEKILSRAQRE